MCFWSMPDGLFVLHQVASLFNTRTLYLFVSFARNSELVGR